MGVFYPAVYLLKTGFEQDECPLKEETGYAIK